MAVKYLSGYHHPTLFLDGGIYGRYTQCLTVFCKLTSESVPQIHIADAGSLPLLFMFHIIRISSSKVISSPNDGAPKLRVTLPIIPTSTTPAGLSNFPVIPWMQLRHPSRTLWCHTMDPRLVLILTIYGQLPALSLGLLILLPRAIPTAIPDHNWFGTSFPLVCLSVVFILPGLTTRSTRLVGDLQDCFVSVWDTECISILHSSRVQLAWSVTSRHACYVSRPINDGRRKMHR